MFAVKISDFISSAHYLREYKGKCEKLHGHNWQVEVVVEKESLGSDGMVIDFKILTPFQCVSYLSRKTGMIIVNDC